MEFCGIVGTLVIDEHGVYDPRLTNDRLLLGVKSTLAEMELSTFRQRSQEAIKLKAARGEMYTSVAMGYVRNGGSLEKDPDIRVRQAQSRNASSSRVIVRKVRTSLVGRTPGAPIRRHATTASW